MKYYLFSFFALLFAGTCFGQNLHSADSDVLTVLPNDSMNVLQELTLTATRKSAPALSLPYTVSVLKRTELDRFQFRTTPEALTGQPGVFIQKTNHGGGSPFVRGLTGNQTLLMVDGIRLNNATYRFGPNQYFNTIDPFIISRVEVVSGTGSVQYGSDALGGVVQVFTRDPAFSNEQKWGGSLSGKMTSQDMEYSGRGTISYQSKKLAVLAGYSNRHFGDLFGGDTTGRQSPSGYREQSFDLKLRYQAADNAVITLAHQQFKQEEVPLYHRVRLENFAYYHFNPQQRSLSSAKLELTGKSPLVDKITFIGSLQASKEVRLYQRNGNAARFEEDDRVRTIGLVADIASTISNNWTANSGVEYYHDQVKSSKQQISITTNQVLNQRGLYPNNATSSNFSVYSLHHFTAGKLAIETGLRYNQFAVRIPDTVTTTLKLGDITVRPASLVGNLGVSYPVGPQQAVYASFSTGYRAPNIDDMGTLGLVDFRYEVPAYDLKPEKTYNSEIGYRFMGKIISGSAAFFYMHLNNLITRVQVPGEQMGGYNVYTKENSQRSFIRGATVALNVQVSKALNLRTNAAYQYGQNLSAAEPMRRIPPLHGRLLLEYQGKKWSASAEQLFAGKQQRLAKGDKDDNRIPIGGTPGWNVFNVYGSYQPGRLQFMLALQNIFNEDYRTHGSGINGMGRSASVSVMLTL